LVASLTLDSQRPGNLGATITGSYQRPVMPLCPRGFNLARLTSFG
jgi:hypothetical protein